MVMWGCYSRLYWAFPRFPVPKGTIISVSDPDSLVAEIDDIEAESHWQPPRAMVTSAATSPPDWWS
jgi:hypothetical protein